MHRLITQWLVPRHVWLLTGNVTLCVTVLNAPMSKTVVSLKMLFKHGIRGKNALCLL